MKDEFFIGQTYDVFMEPILSLIGTSPETRAPAKTYLSIVACSGPFVLLSNCYSNIILTEALYLKTISKHQRGQEIQHADMERIK